MRKNDDYHHLYHLENVLNASSATFYGAGGREEWWQRNSYYYKVVSWGIMVLKNGPLRAWQQLAAGVAAVPAGWDASGLVVPTGSVVGRPPGQMHPNVG